MAEVRKFYQEHDLMGALRRQLRDEKTMKFVLDTGLGGHGAQRPPAEEKE